MQYLSGTKGNHGFEKSKHFELYLSFSSDTLQSRKCQNIDQNAKLGNIYPVVDLNRPITNASTRLLRLPNQCHWPTERVKSSLRFSFS